MQKQVFIPGIKEYKKYKLLLHRTRRGTIPNLGPGACPGKVEGFTYNFFNTKKDRSRRHRRYIRLKQIPCNGTKCFIRGDAVVAIGDIRGMVPLKVVMGMKRRNGKADTHQHQQTEATT